MTRREAVLRYLQARPNVWIPGMELMNAEVGGTRAGGRIHELRLQGHQIEHRPSERSAVHEYRLVVAEVAPGQIPLPLGEAA